MLRGEGRDGLDLVVVAIHDREPGPLVAGVAAVRLGERVRDHLPGRAADGGEQRLAVRVRPGLRGGTAAAAVAGGAEQGGDDVAGGARGGRDVGDGGQLGHPLAGLTQL